MAAIVRTNGGSFLHRLDPRTKLLLTLFLTVPVFIVDNLALSACMMFFFIVLYITAKIPVKKIFPYGRFLVFLIAMVVVLQTLFGQETPATRYLLKPLVPEQVPFAGGLGSLKMDGLLTGLMISCRIVALSVLMPVLTETTDAGLLALGITRLGINYRAAFVITSTLNLIPSFEEEARSIMDACRLRGVTVFDKGNFFSKLKEYPAITFPLIVKAMKRASIMSLAMDARAFGAHKTRTWMRKIRMTTLDYLSFSAGIAFSVIIVSLNFILHK